MNHQDATRIAEALERIADALTVSPQTVERVEAMVARLDLPSPTYPTPRTRLTCIQCHRAFPSAGGQTLCHVCRDGGFNDDDVPF